MKDSIIDFLDPIDINRISNDLGYKEGQIGKSVAVFEEELPR